MKLKLKDEGFGATINGKHTFRDYGLVVGNNDVVGEPAVRTNYVSVPGTSKRIDLTESLTGRVEYESRILKFQFGLKLPIFKWASYMRSLLLKYHGKKVKVVLDSEPEYYFEGRAEISDYDRSRELGTFTMTVDCDPYKYDRFSSAQDWEWDIFSFETGIIRDSYKNIEVKGSHTKWIEGSFKPVVPSFIVGKTSGGNVLFKGRNHSLREGTKRFADIVIEEEGAELKFTGSFTVTIDFRGGSL